MAIEILITTSICITIILLILYVYLYAREKRFEKLKYSEGVVRIVDKRISPPKKLGSPIGCMELIHEVRGHKEKIYRRVYFDDWEARTVWGRMDRNDVFVEAKIAFYVYKHTLENKIKGVSMHNNSPLKLTIMYNGDELCDVYSMLVGLGGISIEKDTIINKINDKVMHTPIKEKSKVINTTVIKYEL